MPVITPEWATTAGILLLVIVGGGLGGYRLAGRWIDYEIKTREREQARTDEALTHVRAAHADGVVAMKQLTQDSISSQQALAEALDRLADAMQSNRDTLAAHEATSAKRHRSTLQAMRRTACAAPGDCEPESTT